MPRSRQRLFEELDRLPQGLREHIERVRREASALARRHEVDAELTDLAAAAHDIARAFSPQELLGQAQGYGLTIHPVEEHLPILLHGPVAAHLLMAWGEEEPQVVEAVRWHSTAQRGLSDLGKVIFLADKLDPTKERRYPFIGKVRRLAQESLDAAVLEFLSQEISGYLRDNGLVHPASIEARNELLMKEG